MTDRTCSIDGCDGKYYARGCCLLHYSRLRRTGVTSRAGEASFERIAQHGEEWRLVVGYETRYSVSSLGRVYSHHRRMIRKNVPSPDGYLTIVLCSTGGQTRTLSVHVLVAEAFHGARPDGMETRHLNGQRSDNRPENLAWGTSADNSADMIRHGTSRSSITHCKHGHEYTPENTGRQSCGGEATARYCLACKRARARKANQRARASKSA